MIKFPCEECSVGQNWIKHSYVGNQKHLYYIQKNKHIMKDKLHKEANKTIVSEMEYEKSTVLLKEKEKKK